MIKKSPTEPYRTDPEGDYFVLYEKNVKQSGSRCIPFAGG